MALLLLQTKMCYEFLFPLNIHPSRPGLTNKPCVQGQAQPRMTIWSVAYELIPQRYSIFIQNNFIY
jgi:hypothetical protein